VASAHSLSQISTLLQYANSATGDVQKFPRLAAALKSEQEAVAATISSLVLEGVRAASAQKHPNSFIRSVVIEPLAQLLSPAQRLMPEVSGDVLAQALSLFDEVDNAQHEPETLSLLTRAVVKHADGNLAGVADRLHELICDWGQAMYTAEDVESFLEFTTARLHLLGPHFDLKQLVTQYSEAALRNDIENISTNRHDEDTDHDWLSFVEEMADRADILDRLRDAIEAERQSIAEHYAEREREYDPRPTSGPGYGRQSSSTRTPQAHAQIGALFKQLRNQPTD